MTFSNFFLLRVEMKEKTGKTNNLRHLSSHFQRSLMVHHYFLSHSRLTFCASPEFFFILNAMNF